ncbi:MAG: stage II sporulation protein M [Deltaproteobacteria bacterium]|nr:stage II sporulation protein M [Deltaproteobacteria bacterium]MDQ3295457.1 stage II sporulation protein M [Myxococcota bacterium]
MAVYRQQGRQMRSVEFRRERETTWKELEALIAEADKRGLRSLTAEQLARLPHLYRATLSSLSVARSISLDRALTEYLESLVGRAYFVVYGTRQALRKQLADFFAWKLPSTIRRAKWHILVATIVMLAGAVAAFQLTLGDMDYYYAFVGDMAQGRSPASSTAELRGGLYDEGSVSGSLATFAASLFSHNSRIGIMAFALGFVAGLPTLLLLFYNGLVLGGFAALYHSRGLSVDLWGWLLPHGVTELLAVILCGAAGFLLAHGLVFPGASTRMDALRERGKHAAVIVIGAVMMLFVAGLIEGIFRQTVTSVPVRYTVAGTTAAWWIFYFGYVGRRRDTRAAVAREEDAADAEVIEAQLTASAAAAKSMSMSPAGASMSMRAMRSQRGRK